jgi:hypothetical protein
VGLAAVVWNEIAPGSVEISRASRSIERAASASVRCASKALSLSTATLVRRGSLPVASSTHKVAPKPLLPRASAHTTASARSDTAMARAHAARASSPPRAGSRSVAVTTPRSTSPGVIDARRAEVSSSLESHPRARWSTTSTRGRVPSSARTLLAPTPATKAKTIAPAARVTRLLYRPLPPTGESFYPWVGA